MDECELNKIGLSPGHTNDLSFITQYIHHASSGLSGKMGAVIYLFHYARYTAEEQYEDYAHQLIEEIQDGIDTGIPLNYADGLAGIGSAICYLIREGFIKADEDEILADFDSLFFGMVCSTKQNNFTRSKGLLGIGWYLLNRIRQTTGNSHFPVLTNKYLLILIQDIIMSGLEVNGYTYPFFDKTFTCQEVCDITEFLKQMLQAGLCNELTKKALSLAAYDHDSDIFIALRQATLINDWQAIRYHLDALSDGPTGTITKHLAELQLLDMSLPRWWNLF